MSGDSLWGKWIKTNFLKKFLESKHTQAGSWMWRKMLKLRDIEKTFYKKVGKCRHISCWYDKWSDKGVLFDLLGERCIIDMGVRKETTVEEAAMSIRRRRRHHTEVLNAIETDLSIVKEKLRDNVEDANKWRWESGFKSTFSTHETWMLLRETYDQCSCARGIWFSQSVPKFAFMARLAMLDRLSTMDRVSRWSQGADTTCVLCKNASESRNHLFFECSYSSQIISLFGLCKVLIQTSSLI